MLSTERIISISHPLFNSIFNLYIHSFPMYERRNIEGLEWVFTHEKEFRCEALLEDGELCGLIHYWEFEKFIYIEHFAISSSNRGNGLGTLFMKKFMKKIALPVVFEVEMPINNLAIKRIHFYERIGFYALSNHYMQPPYHKDDFLTPMLIMSNEYHFANKHFGLIRDTIYQSVYHYTIPLK